MRARGDLLGDGAVDAAGAGARVAGVRFDQPKKPRAWQRGAGRLPQRRRRPARRNGSATEHELQCGPSEGADGVHVGARGDERRKRLAVTSRRRRGRRGRAAVRTHVWREAVVQQPAQQLGLAVCGGEEDRGLAVPAILGR